MAVTFKQRQAERSPSAHKYGSTQVMLSEGRSFDKEIVAKKSGGWMKKTAAAFILVLKPARTSWTGHAGHDGLHLLGPFRHCRHILENLDQAGTTEQMQRFVF